MKKLFCKRCGFDLGVVHNTQQFCEVCSKLRKEVYNRKYQKENFRSLYPRIRKQRKDIYNHDPNYETAIYI